jgi:hypothetical protein
VPANLGTGGDRDQLRRWQARPESWWWILAVVLVPVAVLTGLTALLLLATTHPATANDQLELVRTALSVGAGTGGVVALVLAGRCQWHTEQSHQTTEHDATQRRITDLYTKAADQLGSDKAPVRLAGLYALERVAQDNPGQRHTIVNVLCAYLRMPFTPPAEQPPAEDAPESEHVRFETRTQERQVRLTAQRILSSHCCASAYAARRSSSFPTNTRPMSKAARCGTSIRVMPSGVSPVYLRSLRRQVLVVNPCGHIGESTSREITSAGLPFRPAVRQPSVGSQDESGAESPDRSGGPRRECARHRARSGR